MIHSKGYQTVHVTVTHTHFTSFATSIEFSCILAYSSIAILMKASSTFCAVFADVSMNTRPCSLANASPLSKQAIERGRGRERETERLPWRRWCTRACYSPTGSGASATGKSLPPAMLLLTRTHCCLTSMCFCLVRPCVHVLNYVQP